MPPPKQMLTFVALQTSSRGRDIRNGLPCGTKCLLTSHQPGKKWPLMIFSHGVGCSRLMYRAFCGVMDLRGYVVCAIEHRDGTSPSSTVVTEGRRSLIGFSGQVSSTSAFQLDRYAISQSDLLVVAGASVGPNSKLSHLMMPYSEMNKSKGVS
jgi:hypothetical protein